MRRPPRVPLAFNAASLLLFWCGMTAALLVCCVGEPPKPCPVALQAQYTAELVEACADAGSMAACRKTQAYTDTLARHKAEQADAGCRK